MAVDAMTGARGGAARMCSPERQHSLDLLVAPYTIALARVVGIGRYGQIVGTPGRNAEIQRVPRIKCLVKRGIVSEQRGLVHLDSDAPEEREIKLHLGVLAGRQ